jgi:hypothetical protein
MSALCVVTLAHADDWDESVRGDLSNDGLAPTAITLSTGANRVAGVTGNPGTGVDRDYFSFVVPAGSQLTGIKLLPATSISGGSSFMAIQAGPQVTVTPSGGGAAALLGFMHYGNDMIGSNLLPTLVFGSTGLASGSYAMWIQETGGPVNYELELSLTPLAGGSADVPTLTEWAVLLLASLLIGIGWRRQSIG